MPRLLSHRGQPGVSILVISAGDPETLEALRHQPLGTGHVIAVLLEGFGPKERDAAADALRLAGIRTVPCGVGELEEALESLGRMMGEPGPARLRPGALGGG